MLSFFVLFFSGLFFLNTLGDFVFLILMVFMALMYLSSNSNTLLSLMVKSFSLMDELSLLMTLLTFIVFYSTFIMNMKGGPSNRFSMFLLLLSCFMVFNSSSLILLFVFFEFSIFPISYMILKWGVYPDRSKGVSMMLWFTFFFSLPFLLFVVLLYDHVGTFMFFLIELDFYSFSWFFSFIAFMTFSTKLPIFGVHYWLPVAHVEAPTFGSMLLAGVLLKLGGVGLIRLGSMIDLTFISLYFYFFLGLSLLISGFVCFFQSDFKKLVAFSSVFHMGLIPLLLISSNCLSLKSISLIMFTHGLISPLLFMISGLISTMFSTRQLILIRGLFKGSPLLFFIICMSFLYTLPAPPFIGFYVEFVSLVSLFAFFPMFLSVVFFIMLSVSMLYNLNWLMSMYSPSDSNSYYSNTFLFSFSDFFVFILFSIVLLFSLFIFNLF